MTTHTGPQAQEAGAVVEALIAKLYAVAQAHNDRSCDYDVCKEVRDGVSFIQKNGFPSSTAGEIEHYQIANPDDSYSYDSIRTTTTPARVVSDASRCPNCDDIGDVHGIDGEWRGRCSCPQGAYPEDRLQTALEAYQDVFDGMPGSHAKAMAHALSTLTAGGTAQSGTLKSLAAQLAANFPMVEIVRAFESAAPGMGSALTAGDAGAGNDSERMDWLERQHVEVRTPLRYGSHANFHSAPEDDEETSDLRTRVDAAIAVAALQPGQEGNP